MPIGTLMKKIIRQPASSQFASIRTPAMIGPATADSPITGPNSANALPISSAGKIAFRIAKPCGIITAPTYLESEIGLSSDESLIVPIIAMLTMMVFLPFAGRISDRIGRKPLWWFSLAGLFVSVRRCSC